MEVYEEVFEVGDKFLVMVYVGGVLFFCRGVFLSSVCILVYLSLCWGRWRGSKWVFYSFRVICLNGVFVFMLLKE